MALAQWSWHYVDRDFVPQGEIFNARDRQISLGLSKIDTAGFSVRSDNRWADALLSLEGFIKIFRNTQLIGYMELLEAQETVDGSGGKIAISASSPAWKLANRFMEVEYPGTSFGSGADRGAVAATLINLVNNKFLTDFPGYPPTLPATPDEHRLTGNTLVIGDASSHNYLTGQILSEAWPIPVFKPYLELLNEMSASADGFDWRFMPVENFIDGAWNNDPGIAEIWIELTMGTTKPEAIFEFGDGKQNIKTYNRVRSRAQQANSVWHLISNTPESDPPHAFDSTSASTWGILEDIAQADLTNTTYRQQLVDEHVLVRKQPRHTIVYEPTPDYGNGRLPSFGTDYDVGDIVTGRAVSLGYERFNAQFRVWGVEFTIDDNGVETPKLTLSEQGT